MTISLKSPWRADFPALADKPISYLDSAATCQVPITVIQSINDYLSNGHGNPGRGLYRFSESANAIMQSCRDKVAEFVGANADQIIFTKSATESINMVAASLTNQLTKKDTILVTQMEHHSNLLPWQRLCRQTGATLNILPLTKLGEFDLSNLTEMLEDNCRLFAFTHGSNVLGNHPPVEQFISQAKLASVPSLIDGAQAVAHTALNLSELDCDYYAFSGHKLYAPGGSGLLYVKDKNTIEPLLLGGGIVTKTTISNYHLSDEISRFEAGSANLVAMVGLNAALDYIDDIGIDNIIQYESELFSYLTKEFQTLEDYQIISHAKSNSVLSFQSMDVHCHDVASILSEHNVSVRAGHHCAQPCLNAIGIKHCVRASIGLYNDSDDIDRLIKALRNVGEIMG